MRRLGILVSFCVLLAGCGEEITREQPLNDQALKASLAVAGLDMTVQERQMMQSDLQDARDSYLVLHQMGLPNSVRPALVFDPLQVVPELAARAGTRGADPRWSPAPAL